MIHCMASSPSQEASIRKRADQAAGLNILIHGLVLMRAQRNSLVLRTEELRTNSRDLAFVLQQIMFRLARGQARRRRDGKARDLDPLGRLHKPPKARHSGYKTVNRLVIGRSFSTAPPRSSGIFNGAALRSTLTFWSIAPYRPRSPKLWKVLRYRLLC